MASHPGVVEVHDLHVWEVTTEFPTLSAHVLVEPGADCHGIRRELEALLRDRFGLEHTTLQVEHAPAQARPDPLICILRKRKIGSSHRDGSVTRWCRGTGGVARADALAEARLQVGRALEHDARDADGDDQRLDPADRAARHLPRHRNRPARAGQHELSALADPRLHGRDGGAARQPRPARRHLRPGADVQPRLRRLHRLLDPALDHVDARHRRRAVADPDARRAGRGRRADLRQLERHPHRRLPSRRARARARRQLDRRHRRLVHRARARRRARAGLVAADLPRLGAGRDRRDRMELPLAARARPAAARADRLVGKRDLRARADRGDDRHHVRHPALRRAHDGVDVAVRALDAARRPRACSSPSA